MSALALFIPTAPLAASIFIEWPKRSRTKLLSTTEYAEALYAEMREAGGSTDAAIVFDADNLGFWMIGKSTEKWSPSGLGTSAAKARQLPLRILRSSSRSIIVIACHLVQTNGSIPILHLHDASLRSVIPPRRPTALSIICGLNQRTLTANSFNWIKQFRIKSPKLCPGVQEPDCLAGDRSSPPKAGRGRGSNFFLFIAYFQILTLQTMKAKEGRPPPR